MIRIKDSFTDNCTLESRRRMAGCTVLAEGAAVDILGLVTGVTGDRQSCGNDVLFLVATVAAKLGVGTGQRELGVGTMIETDFLPA